MYFLTLNLKGKLSSSGAQSKQRPFENGVFAQMDDRDEITLQNPSSPAAGQFGWATCQVYLTPVNSNLPPLTSLSSPTITST